MLIETKIYNVPLGYSYNEGQQRHIYGYREQVVSWWGRKQENPGLNLANSVSYALGGGFLGLFLGAMLNSEILLIIGLAGGAWGGWKIGQGADKAYAKRAEKITKLTGPSGAKGVTTDFACKIEIDWDGNALLYREWLSSDPKHKRDYQPSAFPVGSISSIERQTFAEVLPDAYATFDPNRYDSDIARRSAEKSRKEASNAQKLVMVFDDGQILDAGWYTTHNEAALAQTSLLQFLNDLRQHLIAHHNKAAQAAAIGPDDEAL